MVCGKCNKDLRSCKCSDIDERLESLKNDQYIIFKMCKICGKHYQRCDCQEPRWTTSWDHVELCPICQKPIEQEDYAITHTSEIFCPKEYLGYQMHIGCCINNDIPVDKKLLKRSENERNAN